MHFFTKFDSELLEVVSHDKYKSFSELKQEVMRVRVGVGNKEEPTLGAMYRSIGHLLEYELIEVRQRAIRDISWQRIKSGNKKEEEYILTKKGVGKKNEGSGRSGALSELEAPLLI